MHIRWRGNSQNSPAEAIPVYINIHNLLTSEFGLILEFTSELLQSSSSFFLGAELGSRFIIDSGCYMTSLAATIFIASLVTFGVLMITLVIALSTMLQSCENKNSGMVEVQKLDESFSYCKILSLHSQLNSLQEEENELPLLCRDVALRRIKQGIYLRELNFTIQMALTFFQTIKPMNDNRDVVVIDIDEINL